ncbi:MAG: hypothetical protein HC824_04535 [Synechococcales cyanobacterium RM1_1_8]|nr:hypothetical protein [Synechococcales cyanobacterium RM1_1_8]
MDNILDPAWRLDDKPFQAESLILEDWVPLAMLRQALVVLADYCEERYGGCGLYTFEDWHEKNGQLTRRQRSSYGELRAMLVSDRQLYSSRPQADGVFRAYYSETNDFLLRYGLREAEDQTKPIWGDLSFSGDSDDIRAAIMRLKPIPGLPLNLMGSGSYFDATCGR